MAKKPETKRVAIGLIRRDGSTQSRAGVDEETVEQYRDYYAELPPPKVCEDEEGIYWLFDGFHTIEACAREGRKQIVCEVYKGNLEDAKWLAAGANTEHDFSGRRRTNADKRRAVEVALSCPSSVERSNQEIADHCRVSSAFVGDLRAEIGERVVARTTIPPAGGKTKQFSPALPSGGAIHAALPGKKARRRTAPSAAEEDLGQPDDPKWLHGTRDELRERWAHSTEHDLYEAIRRGTNLADRLGRLTGKVRDLYEAAAKIQHELAAIAKT